MDIIVPQRRNIVAEFLTNFTSPHTRRAYRNDLSKFFSAYPGIQHPQELTIQHFIAFRDQLTAQGASPATVNRTLSSVKSLMDWCVQEGLIRINPAAAVRVPKATVTTPTLPFTDDEVVKILELPVKTYSDKLYQTMLTLLFHLGLRCSELVKLKVSDITYDRETCTLRVYGKGDKVRYLPITPAVQNVLREYLFNFELSYGLPLQASDYLFQANGLEKSSKPMNTSTVYRVVERAAKRVGISKRVSPHSCRATAISHLLEKGVSPRDVADMAGHSSIQTTVGSYDKKRDSLKNSAAWKVDYSG